MSKPGEFVRAREQKMTAKRAGGDLDESGSGTILSQGEPCLLVSVLRGGQVEWHGFVRAGTTTLGWVALSAKTAHAFWIR